MNFFFLLLQKLDIARKPHSSLFLPFSFFLFSSFGPVPRIAFQCFCSLSLPQYTRASIPLIHPSATERPSPQS
ncbi:hypothetical protein ASPVEDRAFT_324104 [Aspergillus versicolor CBS 583.65]|uniref:Uncharacterized protein n=1 Tax=Aspergillus versicolor CBS 583.65 TaxID=1036611 RepID=A0A1L9PY14_ASPVE|nr:uncharacterized protein ASPVEDRAFT_324104 [Aspergillus versicolor CBS 583.65]OJJ06414.1 hypothetical protein ASPVEDRAFT_324104 [Aspergillus versicolor CBS 583.65]